MPRLRLAKGIVEIPLSEAYGIRLYQIKDV